MMKKDLYIFILVASSLTAQAQEYVYSLNQYSPLLYHPTYAASDNDASLSFLNRRTQIATGVLYQNNVFQAEYPVIDKNTGRRFGGIGFHVLHKDAGSSDLLKAYTLGLSLAYNLPVARNQFFSFAVQTNYNNKKTSLESLSTGSQWLASEFRFDPEADMGESLTVSQINYFTFNAGALWYVEDPKLQAQKMFIGLSAFNLNQPDDSFISGGSRIPLGYQVAAGALAYHSRRIHITPQVIYQRDNINSNMNLLLSGKLMFSNDNPYDVIQSGNLEIVSKFDFQKDLALGLMLNQPSFSVGFSYNFAVASENQDRYFRNATEFGIRVSKTIWKAKPSRINIENTSIGAKRDFNFNSAPNNEMPRTGDTQTETKSDVDIIQKSIEDLAKVKAVQFHLEKNFHFGFGKADLNAEAKLYLDDLYKLLESNPEYNIEIIGHTDNVGKHIVNYKLSSARAEAVALYLKKLGLDESRVKFSGRGDTQPKAPNDTEENKSQNRRVEFLIYVNR